LEDRGRLDGNSNDGYDDKDDHSTDPGQGEPIAEELLGSSGDHRGLQGVENYIIASLVSGSIGVMGNVSIPAQLNETTMTMTKPTTHAGKFPMRKKNAIAPGSGIPDQTAIKPVAPTRTKVTKTTKVAIETPIARSLSVREAKVLIQNPYGINQ